MRAEVGRLECEHLAFVAQRRFDFRERRARARGNHQFARLVVDDAAIRGDAQSFAAQRAAVEILAAAAADAERRMLRGGFAHSRGQLINNRLH
jgi:hypothetical protein